MNSWALIAEMAYAAFRESPGGKSFHGFDTDAWEYLSDSTKAAWEAAVRRAVLAANEMELRTS